jgi:malate dehydrogenase
MTALNSHHRFAPRVSVVGAGNVGSTLAQRVVERNLADVVLLDIVEGRPQGIALDLMEAQGIEGHCRQVIGTNDYAETAESDIVVITAGLPRKPGMTRDDLLQTNARIVTEATRSAIAHSPNALFIIVTNPLDVMTYLAWKVSGLAPQRVMGMAGILDSSRFRSFIAWELGVPVADVSAMVLGGHGDLMVPLPRYATVSGIPITEIMDDATLNRLIERTRFGGGEIVKLMKTGGAFYAPASSVYVMVEAILMNQSHLLPVAAYLQGEYQLQNLFLGVPCRLGRQGVQRIVELQLTESEKAALAASAQSVQASIEQVMACV